jgi:hypothetical protein
MTAERDSIRPCRSDRPATTPVRDSDLRGALVEVLWRSLGQRPYVLVPEVDIRWSVPARLDALLVSDRISGFEIKSDVDSLKRLPRQVEAFSAVVERAALVVGERHCDAAAKIIPPWWSIWVSHRSGDKVGIRRARAGRLNPCVNALAISSFIPRDDLCAALISIGRRGLSKMSVDQLREELIQSVGPREAIRLARTSMLGRLDWRGRSLSDPWNRMTGKGDLLP